MPISQDQITTLDQLEEKLTLALTDLLLLRDSNNEDYKVKASTILQAAVDKAGADLIGGNVESGNTKAVTGNEVAKIMNSLPNDAVLHYSFDEIPDIPDGTADERYLNGNTYGVAFNGNGTITTDAYVEGDGLIHKSNVNGNVNFKSDVSTSLARGVYKSLIGYRGKVVIFDIQTKTNNIQIQVEYKETEGATTNHLYPLGENPLSIGKHRIVLLVPDYYSFNPTFYATNTTTYNYTEWELLNFYVGDGSYVTPIIDNVNGQNNGTNNGGIAVQGVSGKGVKLLDNSFVQGNLPWLPWNKVTFTMSCWVNWDKSQNLYLFNNWSDYSISTIRVELSDSTDKVGIDAVSPYNEYTLQRFCQRSINWNNIDTTKIHVVVIFDATNTKLFINGVQYSLIRQNVGSWNQNSKTRQFFYIGKSAADGGGFNYSNATIDDFQIFDRALTDSEVMALYLNKANTPKYYNRADWKLEQLAAAEE